MFPYVFPNKVTINQITTINVQYNPAGPFGDFWGSVVPSQLLAYLIGIPGLYLVLVSFPLVSDISFDSTVI